MKILFNCTNNTVGGAVQNAANFIKLALIDNDNDNDFLFLVSREVALVLSAWNVTSLKVMEFDRVKNGLLSSVKEILKVELNFDPDIVYTMAGPTYINFSSKHVMGVSDPYITHASFTKFLFNRSFISSFKMLIKTIAKGFYARFSADFFIFQTETSSNGFCSRYFFPKKKTFLIPNAIGEGFTGELQPKSSKYNSNDFPAGFFYILCPSAYYSHKDIEIIFKSVEKLSTDLKIKFLLTINERDYKALLKRWPKSGGVVFNIGTYSYADALSVYSLANAVILPSILETFSTTYIEAIALKLPLIVASEPFAKEICGNYPYYFDAGSSCSLSEILEKENYKIITDEQLKERDRIINKYGTQKKRYQSILDVLQRLGRL